MLLNYDYKRRTFARAACRAESGLALAVEPFVFVTVVGVADEFVVERSFSAFAFFFFIENDFFSLEPFVVAVVGAADELVIERSSLSDFALSCLPFFLIENDFFTFFKSFLGFFFCFSALSVSTFAACSSSTAKVNRNASSACALRRSSASRFSCASNSSARK